MHFERLKRHINAPHEWKIQGIVDEEDEIVVDPEPEDPVEAIQTDVAEESFVEEQRMSDAADELSEWGPATDSHPMQTRTRTALQEGRPRRRFEQYADYSSSEGPSDPEEVQEDVRLPVRDEPDDFFLEDLFMDSAGEEPLEEQCPGAPEEPLYPDFAAAPQEWDQMESSDSSAPEL